MKKKTARKPPKMEILQPGQVNEFWEAVLLVRDSNDPRWLGTFSHGFRLTAEQYERNRDAAPVKVAA
jgi:hypothetical protein